MWQKTGSGWTLRTLSEVLKNLDFNLRARGNSLVENNTFQNREFLGTNQPKRASKAGGGKTGRYGFPSGLRALCAEAQTSFGSCLVA